MRPPQFYIGVDWNAIASINKFQAAVFSMGFLFLTPKRCNLESGPLLSIYVHSTLQLYTKLKKKNHTKRRSHCRPDCRNEPSWSPKSLTGGIKFNKTPELIWKKKVNDIEKIPEKRSNKK